MIRNWLFASGLLCLLSLVAAGTVQSGLLLRRWAPPSNLLLRPADNAFRVLLIVICVGLGVGLGPGLTSLGWHGDHLAQVAGLGVVSGVILAGLLMVIGQAGSKLWGQSGYSDRVLRGMLPVNRREWIGVLLALLPAAAVEELLFRSLPLGGLTWLLAPWWLLWPLSLIFGLLHWPQGAWGVLGTTLAGVLLSWLFVATGSFWVVLVTHYTLNVTQVVVARRLGLTPLHADAPQPSPATN